MIVSIKLIRILEKYRKSLKSKVANLSETGLRHKTLILKGNRSKGRILDFYLKNGRWPKRKGEKAREIALGTRLENFIAKESGSYDSNLRRIVMATGRKSNHKRKHDIAGNKKEIIEFMKKYGRAPSTSYDYQTVDGEANLRRHLDYYTNAKNDMTFLGEVYELDKCHKSGIPVKYRKIINEQLDVKKPLIRMVNC